MEEVIHLYAARLIIIDQLHHLRGSLMDFMDEMKEEDPSCIDTKEYQDRAMIVRIYHNEINELIEHNAEDMRTLRSDLS
jgi:hypothetical protein